MQIEITSFFISQTTSPNRPKHLNSNNNFASASITLLFIDYMQEQWQLKKSSKSAKYDKNKQAFRKIKDMEDLLKIDLISVPQRKQQVHQFYNPSSQDTDRKSHKSLAVNIERIERLAKEKQVTNVSEHLPPRVPKRKESKLQVKEPVKTTDVETQQPLKPEESTQAVSHEFQYVEKKLKVGKKNKSNAMKDFILETLNRAKAEGTCLVIHKGTAQSSFSPISKNKSSTSKHQKEQFPLVLVQDGHAQRQKKQTKSIFAANSKKISKNASSKSTAINLPSINKKWVKMAKDFQEKNAKKESKAELIEVIEQKIEAVQESVVFEKQEEIIQQIIPERNDSIVQE